MGENKLGEEGLLTRINHGCANTAQLQPKCSKYGQGYSQMGQIVAKRMTVLIQCLTYLSITEKVRKAQDYPNRQGCRMVQWLRATDAFYPKRTAHFQTDTKY